MEKDTAANAMVIIGASALLGFFVFLFYLSFHMTERTPARLCEQVGGRQLDVTPPVVCILPNGDAVRMVPLRREDIPK